MIKGFFKDTAYWSRWWKNRKIDWKTSYLDGWQHPHRKVIIDELRKKPFGSLCEIGCASGPNLKLIRKEFPSVQLGGIDVNAEAIRLAKTVLPDAIFDVRPAHDLFFSDKSVDVSLTDMAMIYESPRTIMRSLREIRRITRNRSVFVEFHHPSWLKRMVLRSLLGYNAYNWPKMLERAGFYDIEIRPLTKEEWPDGKPGNIFRHLITANIR